MERKTIKRSGLLVLAVVLIIALISTSFASTTSWWHSFKAPTDWADNRHGKVLVLSDRTYLHVGNIVHMNHGAYSGHGIVTKLSTKGEILWSKGFNRAGEFSTNFYDAVELTNGDILAVGNTWVPLSSGSPSAVLLDAKGNVKWTRIYSKKVPFTWNGWASSAVENDDGSVTILGLQNLRDGNLPEPLRYGWMSGFALDIDPANGAVQSTINIGSVPAAIGIIKTGDGGFAMTTSTFINNDTGYISRLSKFDATGEAQWSNAYLQLVNGKKYVNELARVLETESGFALLSTLGDSMERFGTTILTTDASGNVLQGAAYMDANVTGLKHSSINASFEGTLDGGFLLSNRSAFTSADNIVFKVGSDLEPDWARKYGNTGALFNHVIEYSTGAYIGAGASFTSALGKDGDLKLKDLSVASTIVPYKAALPVSVNAIPTSDNSEMPKQFGDFVEEKVQLLVPNMGYKTGKLYTNTPPAPVAKPSTFTLSPTPNALTFNTMALGKPTSLTLTLKNTGSKAIKMGTIALSGDNTKDFAINLSNAQMSLTPGKSTKIVVTFKPIKVGTRIANLVISSSTSSKEKVTIKLTGKGK